VNTEAMERVAMEAATPEQTIEVLRRIQQQL
jgi:hypothetical protein